MEMIPSWTIAGTSVLLGDRFVKERVPCAADD